MIRIRSGSSTARRVGALLVLGVMPATPLAAQVVNTYANAERDALTLFNAGQYARMRVVLMEALEWAQNATDSARGFFFIGLSSHEEGADQSGAVNLLKDAAQAYSAVLELVPDYESAINNLAAVYARLGEYDVAEGLYRRLLSVPSEWRGYYTANFADMLSAAGQTVRADSVLRALVYAEPHNDAAVDRLVALNARAGAGVHLNVARTLLDADRPDRAAQLVVDVLTSSDAPADEAFALLAESLARMAYEPAAFDSLPVVRRLSGLAPRPELGEPIGGMVALHSPRAFDAGQYEWWVARGDPRNDPEVGIWPLDAFRTLIRSIAQKHRSSGNAPTAAWYYELSLRLAAEPDPDAFIGLVYAHVDAGRELDVADLVDRYVPDLFGGKASAYKRGDLAMIYRYHRGLGLVFSQQRIWGEPGNPFGALFQLERAVGALLDHNDRATADPRLSPIPADLSVFQQLRNVLDRAGDVGSAFDSIIRAIEQYSAFDRYEDAVRLLRLAETWPANDHYESRLRALRARLVPVSSAVPDVPPSIVAHNAIALSQIAISRSPGPTAILAGYETETGRCAVVSAGGTR